MKPTKPKFNSHRKKIVKRTGDDILRQNIRHGETLIPVGAEDSRIILQSAKNTHTCEILKTESLSSNLKITCARSRFLRGLVLTENNANGLSIEPISPKTRQITLNPYLADGSWLELLSEGNDWFCWGWAGNIDLRETESEIVVDLPSNIDFGSGRSEDPSSSPDADPDGDGLTNRQEAEKGTDPNLADTDGDGLSDAIDPQPLNQNLPEQDYLTRDSDGDSFTDAEELAAGTNPFDPLSYPGATKEQLPERDQIGPVIENIPSDVLLAVQPGEDWGDAQARINALDPALSSFDAKDQSTLPVTFTAFNPGDIEITNDATVLEHGFKIVFTAGPDLDNNITSTTVTYSVQDTIPPVVTPTTLSSIQVRQGSVGPDEGLALLNADDGSTITSDWDTLITNQRAPGTYTVTYSATDTAGNPSNKVTRQVEIVAIGELIGDAPVFDGIPETFQPNPGTDPAQVKNDLLDLVSVTDTEDDPVTLDSSNIDLGNYSVGAAGGAPFTVTFSFTDSDGNSITESRTYNVLLVNNPPQINNVPTEALGVEAGTLKADAITAALNGVTADDGDGNDITGDIQVTFDPAYQSTHNFDSTITYTIDDGVNTPVTESRDLQVRDTQAPVISLIGNDSLTLTQGAVGSDPGATATDVYEGTVNVTSSWALDNTTAAGSYTITYDAEDSAGNIATQVTRSVQIGAVGDSDNDGLNDAREVNIYGSNPNLVDTDGDGLSDLIEVAAGTDPAVVDTDGDGVSDFNQVVVGDSVLSLSTPFGDASYNSTTDVMTFDGAGDYAIFDGEFRFTDLLTLSAWFKTTATGDKRLISSHVAGAGLNGYLIYLDSGQIKFFEPSFSAGAFTIAGPTGVNDGEWHHVALTWSDSAGTWQLYFDGEEYSNGTNGSQGGYNNTYDLHIGANASSISNFPNPYGFFNGQIGGVRVENLVRTAEEIATIYDIGPEIPNYTTLPTGSIIPETLIVDDDLFNSAEVAQQGGTITQTYTASDKIFTFDGSTQLALYNGFKYDPYDFTSLAQDGIIPSLVSGSVNYPVRTIRDTSRARTYSIWFKASSLGAASALFWKSGYEAGAAGDNEDHWYMIIAGNSAIHLSNRENNVRIIYDNGTPFTTGQWYHVVAVWGEGADSKFYIDGTVQSLAGGSTPNLGTTQSSTGSLSVPSLENYHGDAAGGTNTDDIQRLRIGGDPNGQYMFSGDLAYPAIYHGELSATQIQNLYNDQEAEIEAAPQTISDSLIVDDDLFNNTIELLEENSPNAIDDLNTVYEFNGSNSISYYNGFKYDPWPVSGSSVDGVIDAGAGYPARTVGDLSPARTYSIWAKRNRNNATETLFWKGAVQDNVDNEPEDGWAIALLSDSRLRVTNERNLLGDYMTTDNPVMTTAGQWYHLVVIWGETNSTSKIYIDGTEVDQTITGQLGARQTAGGGTTDAQYHGNTTSSGNQQVLRIGSNGPGNSGTSLFQFQGRLALPKIYHGELTEEQILGLSGSGATAIALAEYESPEIPDSIIVDDDLFSNTVESSSVNITQSGSLVYEFAGNSSISFYNGFKYDPFPIDSSVFPGGQVPDAPGSLTDKTISYTDEARTYSFWVKRGSATASGTIFWKGGVQAGGGGDIDDGWFIFILPGSTGYKLRVSNEYEGHYMDLANFGNSIGTDWAHVVVVWGETNFSSKIYVNGISQTVGFSGGELGSIQTSGGGNAEAHYHGDTTSSGNQQVLRIGKDPSSPGYPFTGKLALAKIYHGELNQAQVTSLYTSGSAELQADGHTVP